MKKAIRLLNKAISIVDRLCKNCGAGAPGSQGFQPGNTCAGGGGSEGGDGGGSSGGADDDASDESHFASEALFTEDELAGLDPVQPVDTKEELYELANEARPSFVASLNSGKGVDKDINGRAVHATSADDFEEAINSKGNVVIIGGLKGEKRATEKVEGKLGGDWSRLTDVVRATVAVDGKDDIPLAVEAIRNNMEKHGYECVEIDNRMEYPTKDGYRDINTSWRSPDGFVTELQINTKAMIRAKEGDGHRLYEEARTIRENITKTGRSPTADESSRIAALEIEMRQIYEEAWGS
jgi:hypothetical protein